VTQAEPGTAAVTRVAMWSGPRTVSTALMRSFSNRPDTMVVDEPLYAFYLARTSIDHPARAEIIASMPADWPTVLTSLVQAPLPDGISVYYQKHMTHHLLPEVDRSALAGLRHAFLIRDPRQLLASYARVRSAPVLADLGLAQQAKIFATFGGPVIDSADVLRYPRAALEALCDALEIGFDPAMLSWAAGPRPTDGVWAPYWYDAVWRSTGFGPYREPDKHDLPPELDGLAAQCLPFYEELAAHRLRP
jgi:Sulfotransferase domain